MVVVGLGKLLLSHSIRIGQEQKEESVFEIGPGIGHGIFESHSCHLMTGKWHECNFISG
jgi:hypothetical protein